MLGGEQAPGRFEDEPRDPGFAVKYEGEVREKAEAVAGEGVTVGAVECRSTRCSFVVKGEGEALQEALAAMQDDRGFYGWAKEMMLQGQQPGQVTVVLSF